MRYALSLGATALLLCTLGQHARADIRVGPPRARKAAANAKLTVKLGWSRSAAKLRLSNKLMQRVRANTTMPRYVPGRRGSIVTAPTWRLAGIGAGALMMALALLLYVRRRPSLRRMLPPAMLALVLLVGGALYTTQVTANRAPARIRNPRRSAVLRVKAVVKAWNKPRLRIELPTATVRRACAQAGWRR